MSFIQGKAGKTYTPGYFLAHEECERKTRQIPQEGAVEEADGTMYVPMGAIYPSNDEYAEGIVYEDVDVTTGDMPGSVVLKGVVIESRLPVEIEADAKTALLAKGFTFVEDEDAIVRPY